MENQTTPRIDKVAKVNGRSVKYRRNMKFTQPESLFELLCSEANHHDKYLETYIQWKLSLPIKSHMLQEDPDGIQEIKNPNQYFHIARSFAVMAHYKQKRRSGDDFITHPIAVASKMQDLERKTVAILHDVIEDTDATYEDLFKIGIPFYLVVHVKHMTRTGEESYDEYIEKVSQCNFCTPIKVADIKHNLSTITSEMLAEKPNRPEKYENALRKLLPSK